MFPLRPNFVFAALLLLSVATPARATVLAQSPPPLHHVLEIHTGTSVGLLTLQVPRSAAYAPDGSIFILEQGLQRVIRISPTGTLLTAFGSFGSAPGQFASARGIAISRAGSVYVVDNADCRISRFSLSGTFLGRWGSPGAGDGELSGPTALAITPAGEVLVVDQQNHRIVRFSASGTFLGSFGSHGSGAGELDLPAGIAIGPDGAVYVTDVGNHRVVKFTPAGAFIRQWGSLGTANGQFQTPAGIAADRFGSVYVSDLDIETVQCFTPEGVWTSSFGGYGPVPGQLRGPMSIAIGSQGEVLVLDNYRAQIFGGTGAPLEQPVGVMSRTFPAPGWWPSGIDELPSGDIVVTEWPQPSGVHVLSRDGVPYPAVGVLNGTESQYWSSAIAVRAEPTGSLLALENSRMVVTRISSAGVPQLSWGGGRLNYPVDLVLDRNGQILISNAYVARIDRFSGAGVLQSSFVSGVIAPSAITAAPDGIVFAFDGSSVRRHAESGGLLNSWLVAPASQQFYEGGAQWEQDGEVFIADGAQLRIARYSGSGQLLGSISMFGSWISATGQIGRLARDHAGNLLVTLSAAGLIGRIAVAPRILSISDVPDDQGGAVGLRFSRCSADAIPSDHAITSYTILRRLDFPFPTDAVADPFTPGFEAIATVPATTAAEYEVVVPTREDARPGAVAFTTFMVRANSGAFHVPSGPREGFSHDDLAPTPPLSFTGTYAGDGVHLHWLPPPGSDAAQWAIHRSTSPSFVLDETNRLVTVSDTSYFDAGITSAYYAIVGLDAAGNASEPLTLGPQGLLDVPRSPTPRLALLRMSPNPVQGGQVDLEWARSDDAPATIEVLDLAGRLVLRQTLGAGGPGTSRLSLALGSRLPAGVYLVRLRDAHGVSSPKRLAILG